MRARNAVDGLAIAGALIALIGVGLAANDALAADMDTIASSAPAVHHTAESAIAAAHKANAEAAAEAAAALRLGNSPGLDIRVIDQILLSITGGL